jgi:transcription elongation factor SPT6
MQLTTSSLSTSATLAPSSTYDSVSDALIDDASFWVAMRLSKRITDEYFRPGAIYSHHLNELTLAVRTALKLLLQDHLEVPYIWTHRRDHISIFQPNEKPTRIELLSRQELWRVGILGARFRAFYARRETLAATYTRMDVHDLDYEVHIRETIEDMDGATDATEWLSMKYKGRWKDAVELEEEASGDAPKRKKPSRITQYDIAKATTASDFTQVSVDSSSHITSTIITVSFVSVAFRTFRFLDSQ